MSPARQAGVWPRRRRRRPSPAPAAPRRRRRSASASHTRRRPRRPHSAARGLVLALRRDPLDLLMPAQHSGGALSMPREPARERAGSSLNGGGPGLPGDGRRPPARGLLLFHTAAPSATPLPWPAGAWRAARTGRRDR
ncbi:Protein of unknown function [Gryllus bimaculatus]|nr:Protein of unknown function [Gryllus bimaculatus]